MADQEARIQEVEKATGDLETRLRELIAVTDAGRRTTLVVGIILVVIIFSYMTWLTMRIKEYTDPKLLAETIDAVVAQPAVKELETTLKAEAPEIIRGLREEAVKYIPELRVAAENKILGYVDLMAGKLEAKADEIVIDAIKKHKADLAPLIQAAAVPGNAAKLEAAFRDSLEDLIGPKLDEVIGEFNKAMTMIEKKLDRFATTPEDKLLPEELLEKRLITEVLNFLDDVPSMVGPGANAPLPKFDRADVQKKDAAPAPKPAAPAPAPKPAGTK
jgi:hypothetical protein